ncbi:MAG: DUF892 family protein [Terracidiphilus sp.]
MKLMIEKIPDLQSLYVKELRLLLSAEEMIAIKEPITAEAAEDPELNQALRHHVEETGVHAARLREILHHGAGESSPLKCKVVYSLFDEVEDLVHDAAHVPVRDAALIAEAQRIEHYQIAAYEALLRFARALGHEEDAQLLEQTFHEEELASQELAIIGERVYPSARKPV